MYSTCILTCVVLMTRGIAADYTQESTTAEYTTTSIQEPCVPSQECPQEVLDVMLETNAFFLEAFLTRNESLMIGLFAEGFMIQGCAFQALACRKDVFPVFESGRETNVLETTYCEMINSNTVYWENYILAARTDSIQSVSSMYKKVNGQWLLSRLFTIPHNF